jgi:hypothetical protein
LSKINSRSVPSLLSTLLSKNALDIYCWGLPQTLPNARLVVWSSLYSGNWWLKYRNTAMRIRKGRLRWYLQPTAFLLIENWRNPLCLSITRCTWNK